MSKTVLSMTMSLDGIAAPQIPDAEGFALFERIMSWVFPLRSWREQQGMEGGEDSLDSRIWGDLFNRFGPQIVGRNMFDYGFEPWGDNPPFHAPVFVVTHRGQDRIEKQGGTSYTFVTGGVKAAVEQAKAVADGKDVLLAGGVSIAQQALAEGVVDEIVLHVTPVLAGQGIRLFGGGVADLRGTGTVQGEGAVHLTYEVR